SASTPCTTRTYPSTGMSSIRSATQTSPGSDPSGDSTARGGSLPAKESSRGLLRHLRLDHAHRVLAFRRAREAVAQEHDEAEQHDEGLRRPEDVRRGPDAGGEAVRVQTDAQQVHTPPRETDDAAREHGGDMQSDVADITAHARVQH